MYAEDTTKYELVKVGYDILFCILVFVRLKPHASVQNVLKRVNVIRHIGTTQRASARFAYQTPNAFGGRGLGARQLLT